MSLPEGSRAGMLAFISAIGAHWIVLMSGGVITVSVGIFEHVGGKSVPLPVYIGLLLFFVFMACYLAWRDERMRAVRVEAAIENRPLLKEVKHKVELFRDASWDRFDYFVTITLTAVNEKPEKNTLHSFRFVVEDGGQHFDLPESERVVSTIPGGGLKVGPPEPNLFEQGVPRDVVRSFLHNKDGMFDRTVEELPGKNYSLLCRDSYGQEFTVSGVFPDDFVKRVQGIGPGITI